MTELSCLTSSVLSSEHNEETQTAKTKVVAYVRSSFGLRFKNLWLDLTSEAFWRRLGANLFLRSSI